MSKIVEEIKEYIVNELNERKGTEYYLCDIGMELSESENCNGSWYCSSFKAEEAIKENWDFCGEFFEYFKDNFGYAPENPFENTELFHCQMMIEAVRGAFSYAVNNSEDYSNYEKWNNKIKITKKFINEIKEALENLTESDIF